jgi:hypothetical protein
MRGTIKILIISLTVFFILRYSFFLLIAWFGMEPMKGDFLKITNKTEKSLFYCYSYSDELPTNIPFLDLEKSRSMKYYGISEFEILRDSSVKINSNGTFWKDEIAIKSQDKTLRIFTFESQVINTISWEEIRNKKLWKKKYLVTLDELELLNWSVELK